MKRKIDLEIHEIRVRTSQSLDSAVLKKATFGGLFRQNQTHIHIGNLI